ncbi:MAG: GNAT family N-acetyltransferase [Chitinophaga sp.]|nr:GNAT family N-acetyltransferase [Chitinophaga sp.]
MQQILDNPIYHALQTGNSSFAAGTIQANYISPDIGLFAGLQHNTAADLRALYDLLPSKRLAILFTPNPIDISDQWDIKMQRPLLQMVYEQEKKFQPNTQAIVDLTEEHIPAMLELTKLTNPGPFFQRTIDFGNYKGIFQNNQLVAMIGQRLQPYNYVEVSAVCTHTDFAGRGYATQLLQLQINMIQTVGKTPFLHVYPENPACKLYEKTGFVERKEMMVYLIEKK